MKVVINACHGGFGLSDAAFEKFLDRKGIAWESCVNKYDMVDHYNKGHLGEEEHFLYSREMLYNSARQQEDRSDKDLVAVVEEMGSKANGEYAYLKVVEIPDDVEWDVEEYDGNEWVAEKHRIWE